MILHKSLLFCNYFNFFELIILTFFICESNNVGVISLLEPRALATQSSVSTLGLNGKSCGYTCG